MSESRAPSALGRREFLAGLSALGALAACQTVSSPGSLTSSGPAAPALPDSFQSLEPTSTDEIVFAEGFQFQTIARFGDSLNDRGQLIGRGIGGGSFLPLRPGRMDEGIIWIGHGFDSLPVSLPPRKREQVETEMQETGGSLCHVRREDGRWKIVKNSAYNRRITAQTPIPVVSDTPISGGRIAMGALGSRASSLTPWKTFLAAEDHYDFYFGDVRFAGKKRFLEQSHSGFRWEDPPRPPEHYGWIFEVDPKAGVARKLTAFGRMHHHSITMRPSPTGISAFYMADSKTGILFRFLPDAPSTTARGRLFAANAKKSVWIELHHEKNPVLAKHFSDQTDVLVRAVEAAQDAGAVPFGPIGDLTWDAHAGELLIAVTQNKGAIWRLRENESDPAGFQIEILTEEIESPSGLHADSMGRIWVSSDTRGSSDKNNSFFLLTRKPQVFRVASAPKSCRFGAAQSTPDGATLFLPLRHKIAEQSVLLTVSATSHS